MLHSTTIVVRRIYIGYFFYKVLVPPSEDATMYHLKSQANHQNSKATLYNECASPTGKTAYNHHLWLILVCK